MCQYDMTFLRRRHWAFYVLTPFVGLSILTFSFISASAAMEAKIWQASAVFFLNAFLALGLMVLYAPHYFHWAGRAIGAAISMVYAMYIFHEVASGHFRMGPRSDTNVWNAVAGFICFGIPGILYAIKAKRGPNPYRRDGSLRKPPLRDLREFHELTDKDGE
jgi:hypothetical protein